MTPPSQKLEPPANLARFISSKALATLRQLPDRSGETMLCKKRFCLFQRPFGPVRLARATIPFGSEAPDLFERAHITLGHAALDAPRIDSPLVLEQEHRRAEIENIVPSV